MELPYSVPQNSVLLAHPGTQHATQLANQLQSRELLSRFCSGFWIAEDSFLGREASYLSRWLNIPSLSNRVASGINPRKLFTFPRCEVSAIVEMKLGCDTLSAIHRRNRRFQNSIPDYMIEESSSVIAFDTSAWRLFERADLMGKAKFLDRTTTHPEEWFQQQEIIFRTYPEWQDKPTPRLRDVVEAERIEHELADKIIVGSEYARDSLVASGVAAEKVVVNPYGFEVAKGAFAIQPRRHGPFRFLSLGNIGARKGTHLLVEAWERLRFRENECELIIAGHCSPRYSRLIPNLPGLKVTGKVARDRVAGLLSQCDVLLFPSYSEGFGRVILEALSFGLPVITTSNTGGKDVIRTPTLGSIINAGDVDALACSMLDLFRDRPDRDTVRNEFELLRAKFSWQAYGDRWKAVITGNSPCL